MNNKLLNANRAFEQALKNPYLGRRVLLGLVLLQWLLFRAFIEREVSWSPFLNGDANDYLRHSYMVFDSIIHGEGIPDEFRFGPHGIGTLLLSSLMYLLFEPSRLVALAPNLLFFMIFQLTTYAAVRRLSGSVMMALTSVGLLLCLQIPFQLNPNLLLNIMEYQREFPVFSLFGILIWFAVLSNGYKSLPFSLLTGLIAGITVVFRYVTLFHIVGVFACFAAILVSFIGVQSVRKPKRWDSYFIQMRNFMLSTVVFFAVVFYPLYLAKEALFGHYFSGTITGVKDKNFIALYQGGVKTFFEQVIYYPSAIVNSFVGKYFFTISTIVLIILILSVVVFFVRKRSLRQSDLVGAPYIDRRLAYLFCIIAIFIPLMLLTFYPTRSAQMGVVIVPPLVIMLMLFAIDLYALGLKHLEGRIGQVGGVGVAAGVILAGLIFQLNAYSMVGLSTVAKKHYLEVAHLYDDITHLTKELGTDTPGIASDFIENYTLGCGQALTAYRYEKEREILRPHCFFPSDVGAVYDYEHARNDMLSADILILSLEETPLETWNPYARDPLSQVFMTLPFSKSIEPFRERLHTDAQKRYKLVNTYQIFNRKVGLFRSGQPQPVSVHTTSMGGPRTPVTVLFSKEDGVWHSASPPKFPITIEFSYKEANKMSELMLLPQIGDKTRVPSDFVLQGMNGKGNWVDVLKVKGAKTDDKGTPINYSVDGGAYKSFRMVIFANGGSPSLVTLRKIVPSFVVAEPALISP
ncbi:MAG: hypothetical protein A3G87_05350 [Omnitrophica bacterium RIFCSPLOWO2_12_FULL_50_11]|nr:MAG: hypothetical protein A3G87_05350 [Omnitrophica bacterium RIFCSPLOWO2_12_FULL_50_11]